MATCTSSRLLDLIQSETGASVSLETKLNDLGLDSLEFLELILDIQKEFGVTLPDELVPKLQTVQDLLGAINAHVSA